MKVTVIGTVKISEGIMTFPMPIGKGHKVRNIYVPAFQDEEPPGGWQSAIDSGIPHHIFKRTSKHGHTYWLCGDKVIRITDAAHLNEEEQKLEVSNAVRRHERRYQQLQRQLDAYASLDRATAARRDKIPDNVRLFVWQRDEGKCVKCGSQERLEFDHVIPVAKGGSNTDRNIQLLCEICNRTKAANIA